MSRSLAARIKAANSELLANGNLEAIGDFFTPEYVVQVTDRARRSRSASWRTSWSPTSTTSSPSKKARSTPIAD